MFEDGNLDDSRGGNLDPNQGEKAGDGAAEPKKSRWNLNVDGQEMIVEDEAKAKELMQKGAAYERRTAELKEERRRLREEHAKNMKALEPWFEVDKRAREDPIVQRKIQAALSGETLPDDGDVTDDPYMREINGMKRQQERLFRLVEQRVGGVNESVEKLARSEGFRAEERVLKHKYGKWATDESIDDAKEFAMRNGLDLATAFKALNFDSMPERIRQDVFEEFDIDPSSMTPERSEIPTIDGLGPLTPETRAKLYADTEQYARFKPMLRDARRRETGKQPLPR